MAEAVDQTADYRSSEDSRFSLTADQAFGLKLILPAFALMAIVHGVPIVMGFVMSFYKFPTLALGEWFKPDFFVGLAHYAAVFNPNTLAGAEFWNSLKATLVFTAGSVVGVYSLGLVSALALNYDFRGKLVARTAILVPWVVPIVPMLLTWQMMFRVDTGVINGLLVQTGLLRFLVDVGVVQSARPPFWLIGPNSIWAIIVANVWRQFPWAGIMLYAGLQSIPDQLYEAAEMDGAGPWGKFRYVTLPQLKPVSAVILLLMILWTLVNFTVPYVLLGASPSDAGNVLMLLTYAVGFSDSQYGLGAALSVVLFVVAMAFAYLYYHRIVDSEFQGGAI